MMEFLETVLLMVSFFFHHSAEGIHIIRTIKISFLNIILNNPEFRMHDFIQLPKMKSGSVSLWVTHTQIASWFGC